MPSVDVAFPLVGAGAPADHGYVLYAAMSRAVPSLHRAQWLGVHALPGLPVGNGTLALRRGARLRLRVPVERVQDVLPLAGRTLDVAGHRLHLGAPSVQAIMPTPSVDARLVLIKLTHFPKAPPDREEASLRVRRMFSEELRRQMLRLGIDRPAGVLGRRVLTAIRPVGRVAGLTFRRRRTV